MSLTTNQLEFLAKLPSLLNSSLQLPVVIEAATKKLRFMLDAEAVTVFLQEEGSSELSFWVLEGGGSEKLVGKSIPANKGVAGWVLENQETLIVNDPQADERFFKDVDQSSGFATASLVCVPLSIKGEQKLGALQVLNKKGGVGFSAEDAYFLERVAHQLSFALGNARLYEHSQKLTNDLAVLNRRKDDLLTILSHEIRTPLSIVQSSLDLLSEDFMDEAMREATIELALKGINRLGAVAGRLRDAAELQASDDISASIQNVSLQEVLQVLQTEFIKICKVRNLEFKVCELPVDIVVRADRTLIMLAIHNLLANAVRFTPDKGEVGISINAGVGLCEIKISDTGIGIDPSEHGAIFQKFYEVGEVSYHSSGTYEFKSAGLGLGLSTTRSILEAHGSKLKVDSLLTRGASFSFSLPVA